MEPMSVELNNVDNNEHLKSLKNRIDFDVDA
jgi:hypothetical protein